MRVLAALIVMACFSLSLIIALASSRPAADIVTSAGAYQPRTPIPYIPTGTPEPVPAVAAVPLAAARVDSTAQAADVSMPASVLRGQATWYRTSRGNAAAGPALRRFIGPGWRGSAVDVCRQGVTWIVCVRVRLTDWCACSGERIVDLADEDFAALAPLSAGVIRVRVALGAPPRESITQPPTDTR